MSYVPFGVDSINCDFGSKWASDPSPSEGITVPPELTGSPITCHSLLSRELSGKAKFIHGIFRHFFSWAGRNKY